MAGIFDSLRKYAGNWEVESTRKFTSDEIACIKRNVITSGEFGKSVCFFMENGSQTYISVSPNCNDKAIVGDSVKMSDCTLVSLVRGNESCTKIEF